LASGQFSLLTTVERILIPPDLCAEVVTYDPNTGEFRSHYAGFFDPGFGGEGGTNGVLEVRAHGMPIRMHHGARICALNFYRVSQVPDRLYDGNYNQSGPSLGKCFQRRFEVWETGL
jgi:dCTP deaminase